MDEGKNIMCHGVEPMQRNHRYRKETAKGISAFDMAELMRQNSGDIFGAERGGEVDTGGENSCCAGGIADSVIQDAQFGGAPQSAASDQSGTLSDNLLVGADM